MRSFIWVDGERTIHFGRGVADEAVRARRSRLHAADHASGRRPRRRTSREAAGAVHVVGRGQVHELAGDCSARCAASGSSRWAAGAWSTWPRRWPRRGRRRRRAGAMRAMAVPTTLSGAEMTSRASARPRRRRVHAARARRGRDLRPRARRLPARARARRELAERARPRRRGRRAPCRRTRSPRSPRTRPRGCSPRAGRRDEPDRETLALGALLAGYVIDSTGLGLHHVLAQTLVRVLGAGHGPANAVLLPHTIAALARGARSRDRAPPDDAARERPGRARAAPRAFADAARLAEIGETPPACPTRRGRRARRARSSRPPSPAAGRDEIAAIYEAAR